MFILSRQERQAILFLTAVTLAGIGIDFLAKKHSSIKIIACLTQDIGKINLNQADKDVLKSVTGIGDKIAQRILEYRGEQGVFSSVEELKAIKGITASKYERIKDSFIIR
jgi:competence ComEA-like helix-hairpin-helix protein